MVYHRSIFSFFIFMALFFPILLSQAQEQPVDIEEQVRAIGKELRCITCANQTVEESNAPLAIDMKDKIKSMLKNGQSEKEILTYMKERYGDHILYDPPFRLSTAFLWLSPLLFIFIGFFIARKRMTL